MNFSLRILTLLVAVASSSCVTDGVNFSIERDGARVSHDGKTWSISYTPKSGGGKEPVIVDTTVESAPSPNLPWWKRR